MAMTPSVLARVKSEVKELWLLVYTQRPECFLEALRRLRVVSSQLIPRSNPPPFTQNTNTRTRSSGHEITSGNATRTALCLNQTPTKPHLKNP